MKIAGRWPRQRILSNNGIDSRNGSRVRRAVLVDREHNNTRCTQRLIPPGRGRLLKGATDGG